MSPPDSSHSPIDFSRIREVAEGDLGFERQVLTVFLGDAETRLQQIGSAIQAGDFGTAILESHNLKGASGNVGALKMRSYAEACENASRAKDAAACEATLLQATPELARLRAAIDAYLEKTQAP